MEEHFLKAFVRDEERAPFEPRLFYNRFGDCLEYKIAPEGVVGDRIGEVITIYRSAIDDRPIGFQIKGVSALLKILDAAGMVIQAEQAGEERKSLVSVKVLLGAAIRQSAKNEDDGSVSRRLENYGELVRLMKDAAVDGELRIPAAV